MKNPKHVTCFAHAVHRVAELIRCSNVGTDISMTQMQQFFDSSSRKKQCFKDTTSPPLPPDFVNTRWCTWFETAVSYCANFTTATSFIEACKEDECRAVLVLKKMFRRTWLNSNCPSSFCLFWGISEAITQLDGHGKITHSIQIHENILHNLTAPEYSKYKTKFDNVISKKPELKFMVKEAKVFRGEHVPEFSVGLSKCQILPMLPLSVSKWSDLFCTPRNFYIPRERGRQSST